MILARIFTKIYKDGGIILIDSKGQKYICGNPRKEKPITIKLLKENLGWKILLDPELEFPEAYMRGDIVIENASLKASSDPNSASIAFFKSPEISPLSFGFITDQNNEWL